MANTMVNNIGNTEKMNDEYYKLFVLVHKLAVCYDLIEGVWNHVSFEIPNTKNHIV